MQVQAIHAPSHALLLSAPVSAAISRSVSSPNALRQSDRVKISPEAREKLQAKNANTKTIDFLFAIYTKSRNPQEQLQLIQAIGAIRSPEAVKCLEKLAKTQLDENKQNALISALGNSRQSNAVAVLNDLYRSYWNRTDKRQMVISALGQTRSLQALEPLRQAYKDAWNNNSAKVAVIEALGQSRLSEASTVLNQIYEDNWNHSSFQQSVVLALGQTRCSQAAESLIQIFNKNYTHLAIRRDVIAALGQTRTEDAIRFLQKTYPQLRSDQERHELLTALQAAYQTDDN
jgi:HEAT repeat protein